MSKIVDCAEQQLRQAVLDAVGEAVAAGEFPAEPIPAFSVEIPADRAHGDLAANAAMVSARAFRQPPRKIAETILAHLRLDGTYLERARGGGARAS